MKVFNRAILLLGTSLVCTASFAAFDGSVQRGEATTRFKSPNGKTESCIIPKKLSPKDFSKKDRKDEAELCSLELYGIPSQVPDARGMAVCPAQRSSNPGALIGELGKGMNKAQTEKKMCPGPHKDFDVAAKFKFSITCSYVPSGLAYYQFSRMFDAGRVPPTVLRTWDKVEHRKMVDYALIITAKDDINISYKRYDSPKVLPDDIFDTKRELVYGHFSKNPKKEVNYNEIYKNGPYNEGYPRMIAQPPFQRVADHRSVQTIVQSSDLGVIIPTVVQMKDVSDMVLLDTLLSQDDRPGNISYKYSWYWLEDGKIVSEKSKSKTFTDKETGAKSPIIPDEEKHMLSKAYLVREMLLKDNDCGVDIKRRENKLLAQKAIQQMRHMSADTYVRFMKFAKIAKTPEVVNWLKTELLFTQEDISGIKGKKTSFNANLDLVTKTLLENCRSGFLKLDLNLQDFAPGAQPTRQSCDI